MTKRKLSAISFVVGLLSLFPARGLAAGGSDSAPDSIASPKQGIMEVTTESVAISDEILVSDHGHSLFFTHFIWGAEIGSSIDLTSHDMSTFDLDVTLGYKNSFIQLLGASVGIHKSIHTGNTFIPVCGVIRTSFRSKPSPCFLHIEAGYSFNTIKDADTFGDFTCAVGLGVNFSQSRRARTYMILSAGYRYFNENHQAIAKLDTKYIYIAKLGFGVSF